MMSVMNEFVDNIDKTMSEIMAMKYANVFDQDSLDRKDSFNGISKIIASRFSLKLFRSLTLILSVVPLDARGLNYET